MASAKTCPTYRMRSISQVDFSRETHPHAEVKEPEGIHAALGANIQRVSMVDTTLQTTLDAALNEAESRRVSTCPRPVGGYYAGYHARYHARCCVE